MAVKVSCVLFFTTNIREGVSTNQHKKVSTSIRGVGTTYTRRHAEQPGPRPGPTKKKTDEERVDWKAVRDRKRKEREQSWGTEGTEEGPGVRQILVAMPIISIYEQKMKKKVATKI